MSEEKHAWPFRNPETAPNEDKRSAAEYLRELGATAGSESVGAIAAGHEAWRSLKVNSFDFSRPDVITLGDHVESGGTFQWVGIAASPEIEPYVPPEGAYPLVQIDSRARYMVLADTTFQGQWEGPAIRLGAGVLLCFSSPEDVDLYTGQQVAHIRAKAVESIHAQALAVVQAWKQDAGAVAFGEAVDALAKALEGRA